MKTKIKKEIRISLISLGIVMVFVVYLTPLLNTFPPLVEKVVLTVGPLLILVNPDRISNKRKNDL